MFIFVSIYDFTPKTEFTVWDSIYSLFVQFFMIGSSLYLKKNLYHFAGLKVDFLSYMDERIYDRKCQNSLWEGQILLNPHWG